MRRARLDHAGRARVSPSPRIGERECPITKQRSGCCNSAISTPAHKQENHASSSAFALKRCRSWIQPNRHRVAEIERRAAKARLPSNSKAKLIWSRHARRRSVFHTAALRARRGVVVWRERRMDTVSHWKTDESISGHFRQEAHLWPYQHDFIDIHSPRWRWDCLPSFEDGSTEGRPPAPRQLPFKRTAL